jgi:hypothetical protein
MYRRKYPKIQNKKNPDKEIRKIWEKLEEQSKFNEKIVNMTNLLQKEYCELIVIQQSVKPSSIDTSLTDQIKTLASTCEGKDSIIKELKSCISEKNNIIYNLKEQLTNQGQIILAFKDEQSKHDQIIAALRDEQKLLCKQAQGGKLLLQESKDIIDKLRLEIDQMKNTLVKNQDSKVLVENETIQINVPTRNRFSVLNTLNTEPNEFDKKQQNKQNEVDALIITDSHSRDLDESKLYKYRKAKLHVLAKGKKNIHGAYEYIEESDIQPKENSHHGGK